VFVKRGGIVYKIRPFLFLAAMQSGFNCVILESGIKQKSSKSKKYIIETKNK
jgi:hypothetical protein